MGASRSSLSVESLPEFDLVSAAQVWVIEFTSPEVLQAFAESFNKLVLAPNFDRDFYVPPRALNGMVRAGMDIPHVR
jgi:hypothetical protein